MHASITNERVSEACDIQLSTLQNPGFCHACGADAESVEPDMRKGKCEVCGELAVYGAEETAIMMFGG